MPMEWALRRMTDEKKRPETGACEASGRQEPGRLTTVRRRTGQERRSIGMQKFQALTTSAPSSARLPRAARGIVDQGFTGRG